MYNLDTNEEVDFDWFLNALENEELIIGGTNPTTEEFEAIDQKIAMLKAMHKNKTAEPIFA